jgi:hypothetical protein
MRTKHAIDGGRIEACGGEVSQKGGLQVMPIPVRHALFLIAHTSVHHNELVSCLYDEGMNTEFKFTHFVHEIRLQPANIPTGLGDRVRQYPSRATAAL